MREIQSRNNETLKDYASLLDRRGRERTGLFLAEGEKMLLEGGAAGSLVAAFVREGALTPAIERAAETGELYLLSDAAFGKLSDTKSPQGVIGCFRMPARSPAELKSGCLLILDEVSDPGNTGTLIRTAAACGFGVICAGGADPYSPKAVRSSMSGIFLTEVCVCGREEAYSALRSQGRELCAADMGGENFFEAELPENLALVIGNEARGVSPFWRERAGRVLAIPMEKTESLNAAVCGSVMMICFKNLKGR